MTDQARIGGCADKKDQGFLGLMLTAHPME